MYSNPISANSLKSRGEVVTPILLVLSSLLLCVLLLEGTLRSYYYVTETYKGDLATQLERSKRTKVEQDVNTTNIRGLVQPSVFPNVVYELKPNLKGVFLGKSFSINSFGFRDKEYAIKKPKDTFRIVGLGDSIMFGWGVNQGEAYLDLIEEQLNQNAPGTKKVEVLNFAVPGYNTAMEVATFASKAQLFEPDLVIIHFVNNDLSVPLFMRRMPDPFSTKRFYLGEFLEKRYNLLRGKGNKELVRNDLKNLKKQERSEVLRPYWQMLGESGYRRAMEILGELTKKNNIPVVIVIGKADNKLRNLISNKVAPLHGFHVLETGEGIRQFSRKHGIPDTPKDRAKAFWVSPQDSHPNSFGHQAYAEVILKFLKKERLVSDHLS